MSLKRTPLFDEHVKAGAQMVDFGGWEMPVRYVGDKAEHAAVREDVGVFDVSHMGEVFIEGEQATEAINTLLTNDARSLVDGQAMYAGMLNEQGTFVDDVVAYRFNAQKYLVVINAGNRDKDVAWINAQVEAKFLREQRRQEMKATLGGSWPCRAGTLSASCKPLQIPRCRRWLFIISLRALYRLITDQPTQSSLEPVTRAKTVLNFTYRQTAPVMFGEPLRRLACNLAAWRVGTPSASRPA